MPHQMLPQLELAGETEKGGLVGNGVEGEKPALEEETFNFCDSQKNAANSISEVNGGTIEKNRKIRKRLWLIQSVSLLGLLIQKGF